jgi:polar amino acid transport system substrate-binding protein
MDRRTFNLKAAAILGATAATPFAIGAQTVVRAGATPTGIPFTFLDTKTNKLTGLAIDILEAFGRDTKTPINTNAMQFSALIPSLTTNRIDMIATALIITEERKKIINFSNVVCAYGEAMIIRKGNEKYVTRQDLKGEIVGAQLGTAYVEPLRKLGFFSEVKLYETFPDLMKDVEAGRIRAGFADSPMAEYSIHQSLFPRATVVKDYKPLVTANTGFGFRQSDTELLERFNSSLERIRSSGELGQILTKWGITSQ